MQKMSLLTSSFIVIIIIIIFSQVDHYKMAITENGKRFVQEIDVDEREEIEVFRVPSHNDVERATFYHDFKMVSV